MHRKGSPLTSGRTVLWRTLPFLFVSPILSTFIHGHDLPIYLSVLYTFLLILLFQYRNICHEWITWTSNVPVLKTDDVNTWYKNSIVKGAVAGDEEPSGDALSKAATTAFQEAVHSFIRKQKLGINKSEDAIVVKAAKGLPFALWLLEKESPSPDKKRTKSLGNDSELFRSGCPRSSRH
jgi:hypothetical protein